MSNSTCGLLILCAVPFLLQVGCQRSNQPAQPSSPAAQTQAAAKSAPVQSPAITPAVPPQIQPSEPTTQPTLPTPLVDLPESDVSAVILSKNQDWKVVVDGKPSPHGIFEHPPRDGKASVSFPLAGRCHLFKAAVAINDTAQGGKGSASPLVFVVEGDGKELWRSRPAQKCGETQPLTVDVSGINRLTLIVECAGPHDHAHAVWVEPMLELKPGAQSFNETKEGREAALAMIKRVGGTFAELDRTPGNPIVEVNLSNTQTTGADLTALAALVRLKKLLLSGPHVDDDSLAVIGTFESLETLHLFGSHRITDKGFQHLAGLKNLTRLNLAYTGVETITGSGLIHLRGLTRIRFLSLGSLNKLEGRYLKDLAPLDNLEELILGGCAKLGDDGLEHLAQLDKVRLVDLKNTNVTDAGIRRISATPNLKYVLLAETKTTEASFAHLRKAGVARYRVLGNAFLVAHYEPGQEIRDMVALRYHVQVLENECNKPEHWKISFLQSMLTKAGTPGFQQVDTNIGPNRTINPHLIVLVPGKGWMKDGVPVTTSGRHGESSIQFQCQHGDGRSGCKSRSPELFPTSDSEMDYIPGNWARAHWFQRNLNGVPVAVEIKRGIETLDVTGFKHTELPKGTYRLWTATATVDNVPHAVDFAFPSNTAEFFRPDLPTQISTEAFFGNPGLFKVVYWGFEIQHQDKTDWEPIRYWKVTRSDGDPDENTWGFKRTTFQGRPAIEVSNDGTQTYLKKGDLLELE